MLLRTSFWLKPLIAASALGAFGAFAADQDRIIGDPAGSAVPPGRSSSDEPLSTPGDRVCATCFQSVQAPPGLSQFPAVGQIIHRLGGECLSGDDQLKENAATEFARLFPAKAFGPNDAPTDVAGVQLKGNPGEVALAQRILAPTPPKDWAKIAGSCQDVRCALTKLWGSEEAMQRVFNINKNTGYVVSASQVFQPPPKKKPSDPDPAPYPQTWFKPADIRSIDLALQKLPSSYHDLSQMKYFFRLPTGMAFSDNGSAAAEAKSGDPNGQGYAAGNITFADTAFDATRNTIDPVLTVTHEMTHQRDFHEWHLNPKNFFMRDVTGFMDLSGWQPGPVDGDGKATWVSAPDAKFITDYAATLPAEDFAETGAYYVNQPKLLKEVAPEKYELFRKMIFNGQEFDAMPPGPLGKFLADDTNRVQTLMSCLKQVDHLEFHQHTVGGPVSLDVWETNPPLVPPDGYTHFTGQALTSAMDRTRCFSGAAAAFAKTLSPSALCSAGGVDKIEADIRKELNGELYGILSPERDLVRSGKSSEIAARCLLAQTLSSACTDPPIQAIFESAISASPSLSKYAAAPRTEFEGELKRLAPPPIPPASVVGGYITPAETGFACATGFERVYVQHDKTDPKKIQIWFAEATSSDGLNTHYSLRPNIADVDGCREHVLDALEAKKVPISKDDVGRGVAGELLQRSGALDLVSDFQDGIKANLIPSALKCARDDENCRKKAATQFLAGWMSAHKLGAPAQADIDHLTQTLAPWSE